MKRPIGVTLIACFCLLAAVYLCSISVMQLIVPKAIHALRGAPNVRALRFVSPYLTVVIGVGWAVVAWGLFQLRNWARIIAATMFVFAVIWETSMTWQASMSTSKSFPTWRLILIAVEVTTRLIAVVYLWMIDEPFLARLSDSSSLSTVSQ